MPISKEMLLKPHVSFPYMELLGSACAITSSEALNAPVQDNNRRTKNPRDQNATCLSAVIGRMAVAEQRRRTRCGGEWPLAAPCCGGLGALQQAHMKATTQSSEHISATQVPRTLSDLGTGGNPMRPLHPNLPSPSASLQRTAAFS